MDVLKSGYRENNILSFISIIVHSMTWFNDIKMYFIMIFHNNSRAEPIVRELPP